MSHKLSSLIVGVLALTFIATSAGAAQRTQRKAEPPPPPPQFHVEVPTRTIALERVQSTIPGGAVIGKFSYGCLMKQASTPITIENALSGAKPSDFINEFTAEASAAGYHLSGTQTGDMFGSTDAAKAEILVGASVQSLKEDGCYKELLGKEMTIEATITVDWQIFDPLEKKLRYRVTNEGHTTAKANLVTETLPIQAARAAFRDAAKSWLRIPPSSRQSKT